MLTKWIRLLFTLAVLPLLAQPVLAHSVWVANENRDEVFDVLYGHPEDGGEPYDSIKTQDVKVYNEAGELAPITINRGQEGTNFVPEQDVYAVTVIHDNGYFISTANGSRNVFRPEALRTNDEATRISHTYKFAKVFYESLSDALVSKTYGLPMEVIPLQNPSTVLTGGTLKVQVLYQGQPRQGVLVELNGEEQGTTDEDGVASVQIEGPGLHTIETEISVSSSDPAADTIGYASSLTFGGGSTSPSNPTDSEAEKDESSTELQPPAAGTPPAGSGVTTTN